MSALSEASELAAELIGVNPRRARASVRALYSRPRLMPRDLTAPLLVQPQALGPATLPGAVALGDIQQVIRRWTALGIRGVKIFVAGADRDERAAAAVRPGNLMTQAIEETRAASAKMVITTEVCGCSWTSHGDCTLLSTSGQIDLEATLELMSSMALLHAEAGADIVSPTAMLDGSVRAVRKALNAASRPDVGVCPNVAIHSVLYGPFKALMGTDPARGHRRGLQLEQQDADRGALQQAEMWLREGADSLTLQPVMSAVDVLVKLRTNVNVPIIAYSTSGEYAALQAMGSSASLEYHAALKRAGADLILTYAAEELARTLVEGGASGE
ncbi:hypothetical protein [Geodermatophilus sp. URMC 62]|uniref:hypothetical protein n=1 Tax=Geodermatophilus sp. URMC 62 TaxID=3423414 RepID=UPI00406C4028